MPDFEWKKIIIHHTASTRQTTVEDIRRMHKDKGWRDIGYHYIIMPDGELVEGRPDTIQGAHCKGYNDDSIGVALIGNFERLHKPTGYQLVTLVRLINNYGLPFFYHKAYANTLCPGKDMISLDALKNLVRLYENFTGTIGLMFNHGEVDG